MEEKQVFDVTIRAETRGYPLKTLIVLADSENEAVSLAGGRDAIAAVCRYAGSVRSIGPSRVIGWSRQRSVSAERSPELA